VYPLRIVTASTPSKNLQRGRRGRRAWARIAAGVAAAVFALLVPLPVIVLLALRFLPVPFTPQMLGEALTGTAVHYRWVSAARIAPALGREAIASEDESFCAHHGFDWRSIDQALAAHDAGRRLRGASTISQQTARSVFLAPVRSWVRKGVEAWLTVLMEALWPKERILTVYLNVVDWGHGNFGAEAAARGYFHTSAAALTARQAARLVAVLPDPDDWRAVRPGPYVAARARIVLSRMAWVTRDRLDSCLRR